MSNVIHFSLKVFNVFYNDLRKCYVGETLSDAHQANSIFLDWSELKL